MLTQSSEILSIPSYKAYITRTDPQRVEIFLPVEQFAENGFEAILIRDDRTARKTGSRPISKWESKDIDKEKVNDIHKAYLEGDHGERVRFATKQLPVRSPSGGAIDRLEDGYLVFVKKDEQADRDPGCFASGNGYPQTFEELFQPERTIARQTATTFTYMSSDGLLQVPASENSKEYRDKMDWLEVKGLERFPISFDQDLYRDEVVLYNGKSKELSRERGVFHWSPDIAGCDVLRVRNVPFTSDDIVSGDIQLYDGQGDNTNWNRDIYLVHEDKLLDGLDSETSVPAYRSDGNSTPRQFSKGRLRVDPELVATYRDTGDVTITRKALVPTEPLETLLSALKQAKS